MREANIIVSELDLPIQPEEYMKMEKEMIIQHWTHVKALPGNSFKTSFLKSFRCYSAYKTSSQTQHPDGR